MLSALQSTRCAWTPCQNLNAEGTHQCWLCCALQRGLPQLHRAPLPAKVGQPTGKVPTSFLQAGCIPTSVQNFLGSHIPSPPLGTSHLCLSLLCSVPTLPSSWLVCEPFLSFLFLTHVVLQCGCISRQLAASSLALTLAWPSGFCPVPAPSLLCFGPSFPRGKAEQRKNDASLCLEQERLRGPSSRPLHSSVWKASQHKACSLWCHPLPPNPHLVAHVQALGGQGSPPCAKRSAPLAGRARGQFCSH